MCSRLGRGEEGDAIEIGVRVMKFELLDDPPRRSAKRDVTIGTSGHSRVEDGKHTTNTRPDERTGIALCREVAEGLVVVEDRHFDGLFAEFVTEISFESRVSSYGQVSSVAILADDVNGISVLVKTVGISYELAFNNTLDPQEAISGEY